MKEILVGHLDVHELAAFKLGMVFLTSRYSKLVSFLMTLTFIQSYSGRELPKLFGMVDCIREMISKEVLEV